MSCALLFLALSVSLVFTGLARSQDLIVNGSFEETSAPLGSYQDLPAGSKVITGWTVILNHIDLVNSLWAASTGRHSLDLEGSACNTSSTDACLGGIAQTFATNPGQNYDVSFDLSGNPYGQPPVKALKVSAAGQSQIFSFDLTGHNVTNMGWTTQHWSFTATSAETTLEFESADMAPNLSGWGPALDNVVVTTMGPRSTASQVPKTTARPPLRPATPPTVAPSPKPAPALSNYLSDAGRIRLLAAAALLYFSPSLYLLFKGKFRPLLSIFPLNLLIAWTGIGWLITWWLAYSAAKRATRDPKPPLPLSPPLAESKFCPRCGSDLTPGARVCVSCGATQRIG